MHAIQLSELIAIEKAISSQFTPVNESLLRFKSFFRANNIVLQEKIASNGCWIYWGVRLTVKANLSLFKAVFADFLADGRSGWWLLMVAAADQRNDRSCWSVQQLLIEAVGLSGDSAAGCCSESMSAMLSILRSTKLVFFSEKHTR